MSDETKEFILGTFVFGVCFIVIALLVTGTGSGEELALSLAAIPALYITTKFLGERG
jgi:hypothetical protein